MPEDNPLHALRVSWAWADEATAEELLLFHVRTLRELRDGLTEANRSRGGKSAVWDRVAVHQMAHAFNRFLRAHDMQDLSSPLVLLEGALLDLEHGLIPAMLRPRPRDDDADDADSTLAYGVSLYQTRLRGYAAGIMGGLMEHAGMSRAKAAEWVSKKLRRAGRWVAPNTVIYWRRSALNPKSSTALRHAYRTVIDAPAWTSEAPLACAERLVATLITLHPQKEG